MSEECPCTCGVCIKGYHIFCNRYPHGKEKEAKRWFLENPEATKIVQTVGECNAHREALEEIERKEAMEETKDITALEKEFEAAVETSKELINQKLKEAKYALQEAQNIAEEYGVPFYTDISPISQSYFPKSYHKKYSELDDDFVVELTNAYDEWHAEFSGWQHSAVC